MQDLLAAYVPDSDAAKAAAGRKEIMGKGFQSEDEEEEEEEGGPLAPGEDVCLLEGNFGDHGSNSDEDVANNPKQAQQDPGLQG